MTLIRNSKIPTLPSYGETETELCLASAATTNGYHHKMTNETCYIIKNVGQEEEEKEKKDDYNYVLNDLLCVCAGQTFGSL